jgi:hypothetical protein
MTTTNAPAPETPPRPAPSRAWRWAAWALPVVAAGGIPADVMFDSAYGDLFRREQKACRWLPVPEVMTVTTYAATAFGAAAFLLWVVLWVIARRRGTSVLAGAAGKTACVAFGLNILLLLMDLSMFWTLADESVDTGHWCSG